MKNDRGSGDKVCHSVEFQSTGSDESRVLLKVGGGKYVYVCITHRGGYSAVLTSDQISEMFFFFIFVSFFFALVFLALSSYFFLLSIMNNILLRLIRPPSTTPPFTSDMCSRSRLSFVRAKSATDSPRGSSSSMRTDGQGQAGYETRTPDEAQRRFGADPQVRIHSGMDAVVGWRGVKGWKRNFMGEIWLVEKEGFRKGKGVSQGAASRER